MKNSEIFVYAPCYYKNVATLQEKTQDIFYNPESRWFLVVNNTLAILTFASVLVLILETVPSLEIYGTYLTTVEYIAVFFFTLEYVGRIIANKKHTWNYLFSFFGLIDLIAIVPTYLGFTNLTFLKTGRVLRILRLLRMVRLAKVARVEKNKLRDIEDYAHLYRLNIWIYFFALLSAIIVFGTVIYVIEGGTDVFATIPLGMVWAAKVLLGGISPYIPTTVAGEVVSVLGRFTGLVLFGFLIVIVGNPVRKLLFGTQDIEK